MNKLLAFIGLWLARVLWYLRMRRAIQYGPYVPYPYCPPMKPRPGTSTLDFESDEIDEDIPELNWIHSCAEEIHEWVGDPAIKSVTISGGKGLCEAGFGKS